jgi:hypothetical protein
MDMIGFHIIGELEEDDKLAFRETKNEKVKRCRYQSGVGRDARLPDGSGMRIHGITKAGLPRSWVSKKRYCRAIKRMAVDMMSYMRAIRFEEGDAKQSRCR